MSDYRSSPWYSTAVSAAQQYGIPTELFVAQIGQESSFDPNARNGNAVGIAQFMPRTAASMGVNPNDPTSALFGAAKYDSQLYSQYGSWRDALSHYGTTANGDGKAVDAMAAQADSKGGLWGTIGGITDFMLNPFEWSPSSASKDIAAGAAGNSTTQSVTGGVGKLLGIVTDLPRMATLIVGLILLLVGLFMLGNKTIVTAVEGLQRATP